MAESTMHQAMSTWLKPECFSKAFDVRIATNQMQRLFDVVDNLSEGIYTSDRIRDAWKQTALAYAETMKSGLKEISTLSGVDGMVKRLQDAIDRINSNNFVGAYEYLEAFVQNDIPVAEYQTVVECQCGIKQMQESHGFTIGRRVHVSSALYKDYTGKVVELTKDEALVKFDKPYDMGVSGSEHWFRFDELLMV